MGKLGVVLAILAVGSVALILGAALWARLAALGNAPVTAGAGIHRDELGLRRETRAPRLTEPETAAVVTLMRPRFDLVSGS